MNADTTVHLAHVHLFFIYKLESLAAENIWPNVNDPKWVWMKVNEVERISIKVNENK